MARCCESVRGGFERGKQADKNKKAALRINTEELPKNVQTATDEGADRQKGETRQVIWGPLSKYMCTGQGDEK